MIFYLVCVIFFRMNTIIIGCLCWLRPVLSLYLLPVCLGQPTWWLPTAPVALSWPSLAMLRQRGKCICTEAFSQSTIKVRHLPTCIVYTVTKGATPTCTLCSSRQHLHCVSVFHQHRVDLVNRELGKTIQCNKIALSNVSIWYTNLCTCHCHIKCIPLVVWRISWLTLELFYIKIFIYCWVTKSTERIIIIIIKCRPAQANNHKVIILYTIIILHFIYQ